MTKKYYNRHPVELYNIMQGVKTLTQLNPIDGLRFNINVQSLSMLRISGTWNYGILSEGPFFDLCMTLFNPLQGEPSPYNDFITGEYSGYRGFTAIGSYIPSKRLGFMFKGEGNVSNLKKFRNATHMIELRKLFGSMHIGVFRRNDSFGMSYLHRTSPNFSFGAQIGLTVLLLRTVE